MRNWIRNTILFAAAAAVMAGLLVCSAVIPREAIREQTAASADYLCETEQYHMTIEGVFGSQTDHYADAILLNIAWHYDPEKLLPSVLKSEWYNDLEVDSPRRLKETVEQDLPANEQYLRYWHGSIAIIRPLLVFLNIRQIYLLNGAVLAVLAAGLLLRMILRRMYVPAAGIAAGMIGTACWIVPMSLEYTWVFLIMFVQMHLVMMKFFPKDWGKRGSFFLLSGMAACFLDFLSCETVTLLAPLLLILWMDREQERPSGKAFWLPLGKTAALWLIGYGGMYLAKWGISALVLGENVLPYVTGHVAERLVGPVRNTDAAGEFIGSLIRNIKMVFPLEYGSFGVVIWGLLLAAAGYFGYVHHRKGFDRQLVLAYTAAGIVPLVRFLVLMNHSYRHYFFTYRAQLSTLFALVLILAELTGWGQKRHGRT